MRTIEKKRKELSVFANNIFLVENNRVEVGKMSKKTKITGPS